MRSYSCPSVIVSLLWAASAIVVAMQTADALQTASRQTTGTKSSYTPPVPPAISPATNLPNKIYQWKEGQQIRYQEAGPESGDPVLLVHGLFVNSDHWRKTIKGLSEEGYRVYAVDLWGYGYSSKPPVDSSEAQAVNGEQRFANPADGVLKNIALGTPNGKGTRVRDIDLKHPVQSPYNFYTWSDLLRDFSRDVIASSGKTFPWFGASKPITLVSNSIGTISALQAVLDDPDLYTGVCIVTPNFRELHSAEIPLAQFSMPLVQKVQKTLREKGQGLFDALAKKDTVAKILEEPYKVRSAIDDTLVDVLLDPLLLEGASKVVFDTLSYSAGPLPEQQLDAVQKPVWITYGRSDPWTPGARVDALQSKACVEKVVALDGIGHCPHDEAPELVNPFLLEFLQRVNRKE
jgi:pimeloyl-ACP methyl ester carboxylesterase